VKNEKEEVSLVVLPNHIPNMVAWLLDYAAELAQTGLNKVLVLDLGWNQARYFQKKSSKLIDNISTLPFTSRDLSRTTKKLGLELIDLGKLNISSKTNEDLQSESEIDVFEIAVRSSYSRYFGSSNIEISSLPAHIVESERAAFNSSIRILKELTAYYNINDITTANGRFTVDAAVLSFSQRNKIASRTLERSAKGLEAYLIFTKSSHSVSERQRLIDSYWSKYDLTIRELSAKNWLKENFDKPSPWHKLQSEGSQSDFPEGSYWTYYPTSDWEFSPFQDEVKSGDFQDQRDAFRNLCEFASDYGKKIIVRGHPHPDDLQAAAHEDEIWSKLCNQFGAHYFACNSSVNSLLLAQHADKNFTYESTISVECIWRNIPIILLGKTPYSHLIGDITALNRQELRLKIQQKPKAPQLKKLYPWALFQFAAGIGLQNFIVENYKRVFFQNSRFLRPNRLLLQLRILYVKFTSTSNFIFETELMDKIHL
jgi:hypothetical protein